MLTQRRKSAKNCPYKLFDVLRVVLCQGFTQGYIVRMMESTYLLAASI